MLSVKQRQLNLRTYYYLYKGSVDGIEGEGTKNAYGSFQSMTGLKVDKIYGVNTEAKLIQVIKDIQTKLKNIGYSLVVDGVVGNNTLNAIREFQRVNKLSVDGIVGQATMNKLNGKSLTWDDIKHFNQSEFACKCGCGFKNIDLKLVKILDNMREDLERAMYITSGCRCVNHNARVGGVAGSQHTYGKAADIIVSGLSYKEVLNYTNKLKSKGVIGYTYGGTSSMGNAVHVDIRGL